MRRPVALFFGVLAAVSAEGQPRYHGIAVPPGARQAWAVMMDSVAVYHTSDFGTTWEYQSVLTIRDFYDVCFLDSLRGWICGETGAIFATTDGGQQWVSKNLGGPYYSTRIRFLDAAVGWVTCGEPILMRTASGGDTWEIDYLPYPPYDSDSVHFQGLAVLSPDTALFVAGYYGTWGGERLRGGQGYIVRTTDAGDSFELMARDDVYDFFDVAFIDSRNGFVVGGEDRNWQATVQRTRDAGVTWDVTPFPSGARFLRSICFVGDRHGWACGHSGTILHTSNGGSNWVLQASPIEDTLFDIEFADTLHGMIAGASAILRTTDGGSTWTQAFPGVEEEETAEKPKPLEPCILHSPALLPTGVRILDIQGRDVTDKREGLGSGVYLVWRARNLGYSPHAGTVPGFAAPFRKIILQR